MNQAPTNLLLSMLPAEQRQALMQSLEPVSLPLRTVLFSPGQMPAHVHFLTAGMASVVSNMANGEMAEVGLVGREGLPESLHLLGPAQLQTRCFMQIAGTGLRMRYKDFEKLYSRDAEIQRAVLSFVQFQGVVLSQVAACNRLHEVEERLARWLLLVADLVGEPDMRLTQEFLSQMLGARRSTVTLVAGGMQRSGLIEYSRGEVRISDRRGLEGLACECYRVCAEALHRYSASGAYSLL